MVFAILAERLPHAIFDLPTPDDFAAAFKTFLTRWPKPRSCRALRLNQLLSHRALPTTHPAHGEDPDAAFAPPVRPRARKRYRPITERVTRQRDHELAVIAQADWLPSFSRQ